MRVGDFGRQAFATLATDQCASMTTIAESLRLSVLQVS